MIFNRETSGWPGDHLAFFAEHESEVRYYCRRLPALLRTAKGATIVDATGREHVDFMSACGSLNYGHNHPHLRQAAVEYLMSDGISAALDFHSEAKLRFMSIFESRILAPRGLDYKMQFPGPTGTNCVEAAIKLARKATGRTVVVAFTNAFHGVSSGALSATASAFSRRSAAGLLNGVVRLPYDGYHGAGVRDLERFEAMALDPSGGVDPVAAILVEVVQGEGGLNVASAEWLAALATAARNIGALLIVDEIQTGCGRTGSFFGFERASIVPDLVCLSKSISGYGFPMSLLLMRPELDVWSPGEHNGTFRGNSIAFVTAAAAIDLWTEEFAAGIRQRAGILERWCRQMAARYPERIETKGLGMMRGLRFSQATAAAEVADNASQDGILIECCGPHDEVLKIMPPLNIEPELLRSTLESLDRIVSAVLDRETVTLLERDEAVLDPHNDRSDAVTRSKLPHRVADVELDRLL